MEELRRLAESAGAEVLANVIQERTARNPRLHFGQGQGGGGAGPGPGPRRGSPDLGRLAVPRAGAKPHPRPGCSRHRPHRADPRHLRPAGADERGQAPGRAGAAHVPPAAPGGSVVPPRAPRRRHRHPGTRRDAARVGPARGPAPHRRRSTRPSRTSSATGGSSGRTGATSGCRSSALVGYTNAGKTTLLNRIAGASAPTADQLFVTLDPAARLVSGGGRAPFVLTDTVGFIQKLPTQLVAAFKATLEELEDAQLLLHVVDVSHPHAREHMSAVLPRPRGARARGPAGADGDEQDRPPRPSRNGAPCASSGSRAAWRSRPGPARGSTRSWPGSDDALRVTRSACRLRVPYERGGILGRVYARGRVLGREDRPDGIWLDVEVPRALEGLVRPYRVSGADGAGGGEPARAWPDSRGTTLQEAGS